MTQVESRPGGLGAIFDLSFSNFVTTSIVRIVYIIGLVMIGLAWIVMVIRGFAAGAAQGLITIIIATIVMALWILFLRIWLELIIVIFRIAENTAIIAHSTGNVPTGGFPVTPAMPAPPSQPTQA